MAQAPTCILTVYNLQMHMCLVSQSYIHCVTHTILHTHLLTGRQVPEVREQIPSHTLEHAHTRDTLPSNESL